MPRNTFAASPSCAMKCMQWYTTAMAKPAVYSACRHIGGTFAASEVGGCVSTASVQQMPEGSITRKWVAAA
jgi:hypothetical protein